MDSKKKMVIAISSFAIVLLATVVAIVAVLAAQNVSVSSTVTISYTSREIRGTFGAAYQVKGASSSTPIGSVTANGGEAEEAELTMDTATISGLTKTNNYVDFIFSFTNDSSTPYNATITAPTHAKFTVAYSEALDGEPTGASAVQVTIPANTSIAKTYTVRYTLTEFAEDVTFVANFSWDVVAA